MHYRKRMSWNVLLNLTDNPLLDGSSMHGGCGTRVTVLPGNSFKLGALPSYIHCPHYSHASMNVSFATYYANVYAHTQPSWCDVDVHCLKSLSANIRVIASGVRSYSASFTVRNCQRRTGAASADLTMCFPGASAAKVWREGCYSFCST